KENLAILTDDDGLLQPMPDGSPDPTRVATYQTKTRNYIGVAQLGVEYNTPVWKWFGFGFWGKAGLGGDRININALLDRGDGLNGFNFRHNSWGFAQVYEAGAFLDICLLEKARVRAGYQALWLVGIAT